MKLYEIDEAIAQCFDAETGEVLDVEKLEALGLERDTKIENILLYLKDTKAEAEAIANEIKNLQARKRAAENRAESLKSYAKYALAGEKFKTARVSVSYRAVQSVEYDVDESALLEWAKVNRTDLLTYKEPELSKTAIKLAIENGEEIRGAHIENKQSIIIK